MNKSLAFIDFCGSFIMALDDKRFTDVKFGCRSREDGSLVVIEAHQLVLKLASPVFASIVTPASCDDVIIINIFADAFQALINIIYNKTYVIESFAVAVDLFGIGKRFDIKKACAAATNFFEENLNLDTAIEFYETSKARNYQEWKLKCIELFKTKTFYILDHKSFLTCKPDTVKVIFGLDSLHISSELDLIKAFERYGGDQAGISDALKEIRILNISPNDLVRIKFLTPVEIVQIIRIMNGDEPENSIPRGFSTNRNNRCTIVLKKKQPVSLRPVLSRLFHQNRQTENVIDLIISDSE
ncbi:uncharacterized protein LOC134827572 [Culicoides brevitarsis]|uniref:uncharacterized protein LOC134827572 n=1 Tax=Culicoides brevitarsis TaxID=469753 RepID=UPI00307C856A